MGRDAGVGTLDRHLPCVSVVVPYTAGCPHRAAAWEWVEARYRDAHPDWQIVTGTCSGPWRKAIAVQAAIDRADGDVLVVADADVWSDHLTDLLGATWGSPHRMVRRLTPEATLVVLDGQPLHDHLALEQHHRATLGGGIVVLTRDAWNTAPIDPRYVGWGQEDDSWARALELIVGPPKRLDHDLWHLWHPPQQRMNRHVGSPESKALYRRYHKARTRDDMAALIAEGRTTCLPPVS